MRRSFLGCVPSRKAPPYSYQFVKPDFKPVEQVLDDGETLPNTLALANNPSTRVLYDKFNQSVEEAQPSLVDKSKYSDSELAQSVDKYFNLQ